MTEKEIAIAFLQGAVLDGVKEIYEKYIADNFVHHNPYFKSDKASLLAGMVENNRRYPNKQLRIQKAIVGLPYVSVLSHVKVSEDLEMALSHLFRFEKGKVVELWDISQVIPKDMVNEYGMF